MLPQGSQASFLAMRENLGFLSSSSRLENWATSRIEAGIVGFFWSCGGKLGALLAL